MKRYVKKLKASLIFSILGVFTFFFFSPSELYLGNAADFRVSIDSAVIILALVSVMIAAVFSMIISLLPIKVLKFVNLGILSVSLCFYLQSLFLNGHLIELNGEKSEIPQSVIIFNIIIWIFILVAVFILWSVFKKIKKEKLYITATKFVAVALVIMQITGFLSLYLTYDRKINIAKTLYFSNQSRLELSKEKNVVCFIVDYADSVVINDTLKEDAELFSGFEGFTYYPDFVFTHGRSYPAITYLLSKEKCYYDIPHTDYIEKAFENNPFMKTIDSLGTDIRVYSDQNFVGFSAREYIDNLTSKYSNSLSDIKLFGFINQSMKISAFRTMPYFLKSCFAYSPETVNKKSVNARNDQAPVNDDLEFYHAITDEKLSINESYPSALRFYHFYGSHPGATINENAEYVQEATLTQALRGDFKIIKTYIEQLKELGIYDNTTIIITADHGYFYGELKQPQTCLFLVKQAGADLSKPMITSQAQVSQEDYFATVLKALGGDYSQFGKAVDEISETETRKRYHYNTEIDDNWNETVMKEYLIEGSAKDLSNYSFTNKEWKVKYSYNQNR